MTDGPVRLLDGESTELLRSLLSAGREEEPEAAAMRRTLAAVGAGIALSSVGSAGGTTGASAAAASGTSAAAGSAVLGAGPGVASSTLMVVVKWLAIGVVTGTVASSAVYAVSGALNPAPPSLSAAPAVQPAPALTLSSPRAAVAVDKSPDPPAPASAPPPAQAVAAPVALLAASSAAPSAGAELGEPLAAEVAALDSARQALGSGDAAHTIALLDGYEGRFPEARMLPEALYLRLEAFTLKGDKSSAEAVARRILRVYPSSPHAARARSVLNLDR
jgi:hypothetical protein